METGRWESGGVEGWGSGAAGAGANVNVISS